MAARPGGPVTTAKREDARAGALPGALLVEHADIPPELTIAQWREQRSRERHADRREAARARRRALLVALLTFRRRGRGGPGRAASATSTSRTFDR